MEIERTLSYTLKHWFQGHYNKFRAVYHRVCSCCSLLAKENSAVVAVVSTAKAEHSGAFPFYLQHGKRSSCRGARRCRWWSCRATRSQRETGWAKI